MVIEVYQNNIAPITPVVADDMADTAEDKAESLWYSKLRNAIASHNEDKNTVTIRDEKQNGTKTNILRLY